MSRDEAMNAPQHKTFLRGRHELDDISGLPMTAPEISIILPAFNEAKNIPLIVDKIADAMGEPTERWESAEQDELVWTYEASVGSGSDQWHYLLRCTFRKRAGTYALDLYYVERSQRA